jgi:hypothetical protein
LMGMRFPIFRQVQNNYRFGWKRHIDPAWDHKDSNPATLASRILWLPTVSQSIDLTMKANPSWESKNTIKNKIKRNSIEVTIADEWLSTRSWGLANR